MSIKQSAIRVGELLQDSGIVRPEEMIEAIQVSKRLGVPIGRVLMMSGWVRADELEAALHSQVLLRTEQIARSVALNALRRVHEQRISLIDALSGEDIEPQLDDNPALLAELLLDSNLVSPEQIELAYEKSHSTGIPLASALVLQGVLSPNLFPSLQRIQQLIENGEMSLAEGVAQVQNTFMLWLKAEESLNKDTFPEGRGSVRPEITAPLMTESNPVIIAEPQPQTTELPVGPSQTGIAASATDTGEMEVVTAPTEQTPHQVEEPKQEASPKQDLDKRGANQPEAEEPQLRLVDLLKVAGVFSQEDIQKRYQALLNDPIESGKFFIEMGLISEEEAKVALRSHSLLTRGLLNQQEAVSALRQAAGVAQTAEVGGESSSSISPRVQRYMDKKWRGKVSRALGGAIIGALVAGLTLSTRREKK